jgi:site-specific recombinase XerD
MKTYPLPLYVQRFFTERLLKELQVSPNTVASYRDTFRLLLKYLSDRLGRLPTDLTVADVDAERIGEFLCFIEESRLNGARSRNQRLAALRSFFKYVSIQEPQLLHHSQRILSMASKRYEKRDIAYLKHPEIEALIAAPDPATWIGRRDQALLLLAFQTGLRVSEIIQLKCEDVVLGVGAHVRCMGKGRKERVTPLRKDSAKVLGAWLAERGAEPTEPLFISLRGQSLSRDAVARLVRTHTERASGHCSSLRGKRVTPHVLRHSAAMQLLQSGVDRTVIALWLGHESVETTQMYIHADIEMKEKAMEKTKPMKVPPGRYRPGDKLITFLESL